MNIIYYIADEELKIEDASFLLKMWDVPVSSQGPFCSLPSSISFHCIKTCIITYNTNLNVKNGGKSDLPLTEISIVDKNFCVAFSCPGFSSYLLLFRVRQSSNAAICAFSIDVISF